MKNKFLATLSIVVLLFVCFSCDNNIETTSVDEGAYSKADKEEFIKLANKYGSEVVFIDDKLDTRISIEKFERLLMAMKDLKAEYSLSYAIFYKTPTELMIPRSRSYQSSENHPVSSFTVTIEQGESFSCSGEVYIFFSSTGNDELTNVTGHVSFHMGETHSQNGYIYSIEPFADEIIEPSTIKKGEKVSSVTFKTTVMVTARLGEEIVVKQRKVFTTTVPTDEDGNEVYCTVE